MKKFSILSILFLLSAFCLTSCSSSDDDFDYPLDELYGCWRITHVEIDGKMLNVTGYYSTVFKPTYATFKKNGRYHGKGYFGEGSGTYDASGDTITCYIDGEALFSYKVISLFGSTCELLMRTSRSENSLKIRCKKYHKLIYCYLNKLVMGGFSVLRVVISGSREIAASFMVARP